MWPEDQGIGAASGRASLAPTTAPMPLLGEAVLAERQHLMRLEVIMGQLADRLFGPSPQNAAKPSEPQSVIAVIAENNERACMLADRLSSILQNI